MKRLISHTALIFALVPAGVAGATQQSGLGRGSELEVPSGPAPRAIRLTNWDSTPAGRTRAWDGFKLKHGTTWRSLWDRDTGAPHRIFGGGIAAANTVASASAAATHARSMLAQHIALLAPGSTTTDFTLVANEVHRGLRTVAFVQNWQGMPVIGGQLAFQYKNDRLFVISSQAFPYVSSRARSAAPLVQRGAALQVAKAWMLQDAATFAAPRPGMSTPMILPLVRGKRIEYRTVVRTSVATSLPLGDWSVYIDAHSGRAVARTNQVRFGSGQVLYNTPIRRPDGDRADYPAPYLDVDLGSSSATSDADGVVSWAGDSPIDLTLTVGGPLVGVNNEAGDDASKSTTLSPGGQIIWNRGDDELIDAQLAAYVHTHIVKEYARGLAPSLAWLDEKLAVNVNLDDECNAFYEPGGSINFFQSSSKCQNTGRLPDVVYHEFGHALHANSIITGVGAFEGAFSEGLSDYLAATINDDSGMGRGFFYGDEPLREINPEGMENRWPEDVGEIHTTGIIFAGAMWDLRTAFIEEYGRDEGVALADRLFFAAVQSATDIPSTYVSVIAEDDDDGDLANGTPNICTINKAFGKHGLRTLGADIVGLAAEAPNPQGHPVTMTLSGLFEACPGDKVVSAKLSYNPVGQADDEQVLDLEDLGEDVFSGLVPPPGKSGTLEYQITLQFADGNSRKFPENPADPKYQFYVGETIELYCTDFEENPFDAGWGHGLSDGEESEGADDWMWGEPAGTGGSGDPSAAYSGTKVIGNDLGGEAFNGQYQANKTNFAVSPPIEIQRYSDVRLHYRRWLTVEDAFFDKATIYVDEFRAWQNLDSDNGNNSKTHHRDHEWRFHDVALSPFIVEDQFRLKFEISSDAGLEFGGWTIDELCVVADANSICGDGKLSGAERCDDGVGNSNSVPDACRDNCRVAGCGDGIKDGGEQCDDGNLDNGDGCNSSCERENKADCGFSVAGTRDPDPSGSLVLLSLAFVGLIWRRRRR